MKETCSRDGRGKGPAWDRKHPSSSGHAGKRQGHKEVWANQGLGRDKEEASGSRGH